MLYIGKFINNFKDFYNEINSATLTGAIDVIVVRQPDGSYSCSPFHVRFGKIGVLRSREKIVDIEVNGSPVNIHMKLGESGEAFFVEEVDDEHEIPAYLATSPLPDMPNIESELEKMIRSASLNGDLSGETIVQDTCNVNIDFNNCNPEMVLNNSSLFATVVCDKTVNIPSSDTSLLSNIYPIEQSVPKTEEDEINVSSGAANSIHTDSSDEIKTKRKRRKKVSMKKRSKTKDKAASVPPRQNDFLSKDEGLESKPEEIFQMDDDYAEGYEDEGFSGLSRSISLPVTCNTIDKLFGSEWTRRKASSTFTGEFHPFSDGDVTPHSSPIASRPPSPKSDTEYENQKIDILTPTDANAPSWGWGELPNVPTRRNSMQAQDQSHGSLLNNLAIMKEEENAVEAEKRSMLGGVLNFMRSTKKIRHMPESEGIYLSDLTAEELDPEVASLYFPKFKSPYGPPNQEIKDDDTESGKGPSLPHSPHTVEGYASPASQDSDSDGGLMVDHFSKEKGETASYPYSDIAMSLCGGLQDPDIDLPEERFLHSLITFDEFAENPGIVHDANLVIRIGGKYYNWSTASPMLMSIIMFQRPLPEKTANQLINEHMPKKKKSKPYTSWWSWRRSETETKSESENKSDEPCTPQEENSENPNIPVEMEEAAEGMTYPKTCDPNMYERNGDLSEVQAVLENVTEAVVEVDETVTGNYESVQLEEVIVESPPNEVENVIIVTSPSKDSSTLSSSPIEISNQSRQINGNPSTVSPETLAQAPFSAKEDKSQNKEKYKKSLRLTSQQIAKLNLQEGPNEFAFSVTTAYQGTTKCTCQVFLWNYDDKIVISDIDGTITKSDVLGHILPMVGHSWAQLGVAKLFTKIQSNGYKFLYLSARAIGQARITREYLRRVRQGEICLPDGPLLLSPTSLISALHREVIERKPEEFKISCLKDIQTLFPSIMGNPFYAGFGNKINDTWAYRAVDIPITRVFTINHRGELKLELIQTFQSSYSRLSDDVDHVFPPIKPTTKVNGHPMPMFSSPEEFSYFTYWREPLPLLVDDDFVL